jgi:hypothetical protein
MSQLIRDIDPEEIIYDHSSPAAMICHQYCHNLLVSTGIDAAPPGKDNILDAFTKAKNICNLCNLVETKYIYPVGAHFEKNSTMDHPMLQACLILQHGQIHTNHQSDISKYDPLH